MHKIKREKSIWQFCTQAALLVPHLLPMTLLLLSSEFVCVTVKDIDYSWQQV